jgi:phosphate transport system substrate-binding protein
MKLKVMIAIVTAGIGLPQIAAADRVEIQNKGSDTLVNVAQAWAEAYQEVNSDVAVAVSGGGSGTGIAALINGTVDIANASRQIKPKEIKLADERGHHPVEYIVGYDALAVFLNSKNPVQTLDFEQLRQIFGRGGKATRWSDIGIEVPGCKGQQIVVVSRQNNSGTYAYFRETVLGKKGKYRQGTLDMHGSKDVVDLVEKTPCAIGYSGLAYATPHVKMACVAESKDAKCVAPSEETASDRSYPIARPLMMYTSGEPKGEVKAYLDWVLSDAGQCIIKKKGYAPVREISCD